MANDIEWGQGAKNNAIGWGQGAANNSIGWGLSHFTSPSGETEIYGIRQDANVTAFLTATGITDTTITSALEELVLDLKSYSIWDKMKAIYPFVGGTATTHKFNLVNSADTDAAFRLAFSGGWTHSSTGALPNGTNGYANTFLTPSVKLIQNSTHISTYTRSNTTSIGADIGSSNLTFANGLYILPRFTDNYLYGRFNDNSSIIAFQNLNATGYYIGSRSSVNVTRLFKNNVLAKNDTTSSSGLSTFPISIGAGNIAGTQQYSNRQTAFATIGDGLTDEDSANLYYSVQKFQTTLGRQVGTPIYSSNATDVNARLFLGATNIQDATITSAVDTLVQGLKTDGVWTKLKAVYPFVGGTATTHKFNLANALDEDASFRLAFSGGWTHSANGALPNGTNGYANTFFVPSTNLVIGSQHLSVYNRTNNTPSTADSRDIGTEASNQSSFIATRRVDNLFISRMNSSNLVVSNSNASGYFISTRNVNTLKAFKNNSLLGSAAQAGNLPALSIFLANNNILGVPYASGYSNQQLAFSTIGDGLTDTDAANLYTRVQAFQTTLNRQV